MSYLERARKFLSPWEEFVTPEDEIKRLAAEMEKIARAEFERGARAQRVRDGNKLIASDSLGERFAQHFVNDPLVEYQPEGE